MMGEYRYNSFDVPGTRVAGPEYAALTSAFMHVVAGRTLLAMRFQARFWASWGSSGGGITRLTRAEAMERLRGSAEWLVLNQESERLARATAAEIGEFFEQREPWGRSDWYFFDEAVMRCLAFTHDEEWLERAANPAV